MITIREFIQEAKNIVAQNIALEQKQQAIGEALSALSRRDDLLRYGYPVGPTDASPLSYILWREPPYVGLILGVFDEGYVSPVHEHSDFWVVGCGYRGQDRWDLYERMDDGSRAGYSDLKLVNQIRLPRGTWTAMPRPPRAIHSHNNEVSGNTLELIFSCEKPLLPEKRLIYDVEGHTHWPSGFDLRGMYVGNRYPPPPAYGLQKVSQRVVGKVASMAGRIRHFCPVCSAFGALGFR